jgi:hypothetical protein
LARRDNASLSRRERSEWSGWRHLLADDLFVFIVLADPEPNVAIRCLNCQCTVV